MPAFPATCWLPTFTTMGAWTAASGPAVAGAAAGAALAGALAVVGAAPPAGAPTGALGGAGAGAAGAWGGGAAAPPAGAPTGALGGAGAGPAVEAGLQAMVDTVSRAPSSTPRRRSIMAPPHTDRRGGAAPAATRPVPAVVAVI